MSLLESKRGIEEAESVSRLTELAFIFIPLTCAASLFSMQIRELADNHSPLYAFVIAASVAVTVSYGLRLMQRSVALSDKVRGWEDRLRREENVTTRVIPIRTIARWMVKEFGLKGLTSVTTSGTLVLLLEPLRMRPGMDLSVKGVMTGFFLFCVLLMVGLMVQAQRERRVIDTFPSEPRQRRVRIRTYLEGPCLIPRTFTDVELPIVLGRDNSYAGMVMYSVFRPSFASCVKNKRHEVD